jgi:subtilisin-like proprotein convertase family protein
MNITKLASLTARAMVGLLAAGTGAVALTSSPAEALPTSCTGTNGTDVAIRAITYTTSPINIPYCQAGVGSHVRIDVHLKHPQSSNLIVWAIAPDGTQRKVQDGNVPGSVDLNSTYRWTTSAASSAGTWTLKVWDSGVYSPGGIIDSWTVSVISPSCWRVNLDDAVSWPGWNEGATYAHPQAVYHPPTPASSSVSVSTACQGKASEMRIGAQLKNVWSGDLHDVRLFRNGVAVPIAKLSQTVVADNGDFHDLEVWYTADGSQLDAAGTWTLQVTTSSFAGTNPSNGITMDSWVMHTSY